MSTGSPEPGSWRRVVAALVLPALLVGSLTACGEDSPTPSYDADAGVAAAIQRTLRLHARAILDGDSVAFDRTLAQRDHSFVAAQDRYFDNLGQLPLSMLRLELAEETLRPSGDAYWGQVTIRLELQGYDVAPVVTRDRWRFAPTRDQRRYLLTSTTDARWEAESGPPPQPWDLGQIEVREGSGVLGIFDQTTGARADAVLQSVSEARFDVRAVLPTDIEDPGGVVVYALADPAFVESLNGLPVNDPERLDGATVPVPRDASDPDGKVASYRIVLNPDVLDQSDDVLDRLVRHELTHVALGDHARGVPMWLTEGLAEYVSVQPIAPADRRLQTDALDVVAPGVDDLPSDDDFSGEHAEGWYAVSWWVCEYVAATYGEAALWQLLEGLADGDDQQTVVRDQLGIKTTELVRAGVALMRHTYG